VAVAPEYTFTVTAPLSADPVKVGVLLLTLPVGPVTATEGGVVSTVNARDVVAWFPAESDWCTTAV
jgi:hypothetical protein